MPYPSPADRQPPVVPAWVWWLAGALVVACCVGARFTDLAWHALT